MIGKATDGKIDAREIQGKKSVSTNDTLDTVRGARGNIKDLGKCPTQVGHGTIPPTGSAVVKVVTDPRRPLTLQGHRRRHLL